MVRCWIFRSMKEEMGTAFSLVESSKQLWDELSERYSQSNAPLLYQLKRELGNIEQEEIMSVTEYYGKLKRYWDEIYELEGIPSRECTAMSKCTCNLYKKLVEREEKCKTMEFLMRLNKNYEDIRGSILAVEPIPSLNKVFQLVHQAEKQTQVTGCLQGGLELNAFNVNKQYHNQGYVHKKDFRKNKMDKKCDYCGIKGHLKVECFKLVGYPV